MEISELGREIAEGLVETGVEGDMRNVCCSTKADELCIGVSSWEDSRADELLSMIDGASRFIGMAYSDMTDEDIEELGDLLESEQGYEAQLEVLGRDCETYAQACIDGGLTDARAVIYAGIWCPTSHYCVERFLRKRVDEGYVMDDLLTLAQMFADEYATAVDCEEYQEGYANRAWSTYNYVKDLDLSEYGYED